MQVFEGIELHAVIQRLRSSISEKVQSKRGRSRQDTSHSVSLPAASLLLEAIYLKAVSLQKLGRLTEAAQECKSVLDTIETVFFFVFASVYCFCRNHSSALLFTVEAGRL